MLVICQLHEAGWLFSVRYIRQVFGYLRQIVGYLSVTRGRWTVICQQYETGRLLSVSYIKGRVTVNFSYMRQVDCYLPVTWGMLSVSVSYMMQDDGYLSVQ